MTTAIPNEGVIWYRGDKAAPFRKYTLKADTTGKILLTPETFSMFRRSVSFDLHKYFVQIIPAARVTVRGMSAAPRPAVVASNSSSAVEPSKSAPKPEEDRFHNVEAYLSLMPMRGPDSARVVLRARDASETKMWFKFLCGVAGKVAQSAIECFPYGNPLEPAPPPAVPEPEVEAKKKSENEEHVDGQTTSSSATSSGDEANLSSSQRTRRERRRTQKRQLAQNRTSRSRSLAFEDIPLVKATSVSAMKGGDKKRRHSTGNIDTQPDEMDWTLVVEEASTDEESSLLQKQRSHKRTLVSSTARHQQQRWLLPSEKEEEPLVSPTTSTPVPKSHRHEFLEQLWERCLDKDDELLFHSKERQPLESEFAMATISVARQGASAAYLFDQADQRTTASCKAAVLRNGVPMTILCVQRAAAASLGDSPDCMTHRLAREWERRCPSLALLHFDSKRLRIELGKGERLTISFDDIVSVLPEDVDGVDGTAIKSTEPGPSPQTPTPAGEGGSSTDTSVIQPQSVSEERGLSPATTSGQKITKSALTHTASSKMLRRLSPTPSNASAHSGSSMHSGGSNLDENADSGRLFTVDSGDGGGIDAQEPTPPHETPLALVLPPASTGISAPNHHRLHLYIAPAQKDAAQKFVSPARCRPPIICQELMVCVIGFEFAIERKAVQRILIECCARVQQEQQAPSSSPLAESGAPAGNTLDASTIAREIDFSTDYLDAASTEVGREQGSLVTDEGGAFYGDFDAAVRTGVDVTNKQSVQYRVDSILGANNIYLGPTASTLSQTYWNDVVLDCLQYDAVQLYLNSARKTF